TAPANALRRARLRTKSRWQVVPRNAGYLSRRTLTPLKNVHGSQAAARAMDDDGPPLRMAGADCLLVLLASEHGLPGPCPKVAGAGQPVRRLSLGRTSTSVDSAVALAASRESPRGGRTRRRSNACADPTRAASPAASPET